MGRQACAQKWHKAHIAASVTSGNFIFSIWKVFLSKFSHGRGPSGSHSTARHKLKLFQKQNDKNHF